MSIQVGVRVRPFNSREKERESECIIDMPGNNQTVIKDELGREKKFTFDHSFWSHDGFRTLENGYLEPEDDKYADQKLVFDTVGKQILDNAWQGYHCCLFAYGQTGSGKSYSMVGYGANKGIVPISCDEIFKRIGQNTDKEKTFEVQVSMLEIYNEKVQDLLIKPDKRPPSGLKIRESKVLGIFVDGLSKHPVTSYEQISKKMDEGYNNRTIGSTLMNATSSRAHTIVTVEFRQVTMVAKKRSEKLSMINLVDLAGSERSGSTGATGDRLKEGCNINKSLLILGNVINCLADKAIGKNKNMLPPYRDSALTRILQNALGGNSKTVMICALSPASINYEETLSTLRYADRAKKIQNKAVINESEHDKMVRLLKEENQNLKKMLENLQKKLGGQGGVMLEDDKKAFLELKEQYEANQKMMGDMQKTFEEKLEEARKQENESIGTQVNISLPHLVVLNEDPQLSHKLKYPLDQLPVYVGRKHGNPTPQIVLSGIGIKPNHAIFVKDENSDDIILKPNDKDAKSHIFVNGKKIGDEGQILKTKDVIIFGTNTILLYMKSSKGDDIYGVDWEKAQMELKNEIEKENKKLMEEREKKNKEQLDSLKKLLVEEYSKKENEMEEKLRKQVEEYQLQFNEMNKEAEKKKMEQEKLNKERIMKEEIEKLEAEKERKKKEAEIKEKNELKKREQAIKNKEFIHSNEKLKNNLITIIKKISKMNIIMNDLKRDINLKVIIQKNLEEESSEFNTSANLMIRVENYEEGTVYYWNIETFQNRYDSMKDLFNKFNDEELEIQNIKKEEDPLWDEGKPILLGYAFYRLEPVAYLMSNRSTIPILSQEGEVMGTMDMDIIPHDDSGNEFDEIPELPSELIGQKLLYKVKIIKIENIPKNFSANLKVEYKSFYDHSIISTKIYNPKAEFNNCLNEKNNVDINEEFEHKIDFLTKEDIDYLENEKLCFKIYASEQIEKRGKTSIEEILRNIKDEEEEEFKEEPKINNNGNNIIMKDWDIVTRNDMNNKNNNNNDTDKTNNSSKGIPGKKNKKKGCNIF